MIHTAFEDPAELKEVAVRETASAIAKIGAADKMNAKPNTMMSPGAIIMASTTPTLWSKCEQN